MGIVAIKWEKVMEREVISFKEFKEILNDIGLNTDETERFVHKLVVAVEFYGDAFIFYNNIIMEVTPKEEMVYCDIHFTDVRICDIHFKDVRIEVALKQPVVEEVTKEILKERLVGMGLTPAEADARYEILKKNENENDI
jgi:hypothetical protein